MNRRLPIIILLVMAGAGVLVSCGLINPETTPPETPETETGSTPVPTLAPSPTPTEMVVGGTISLWHSLPEAQSAGLVAVIDAFQDTHPDVLFDVLYVPEENLRQRFETAALEGAGPVILMGPAEWGPPLFDQGLLVELDPEAPADLLARISPAALGAVRYREALIGLPYSQEGIVLYRNRRLITEAVGDFEDMVRLAQSVSQGEVHGAVFKRSFFYAGADLNGIGGRLMEPDGQPAFNDESGLAWIELLRALDQAGPTVFFSDEDRTLFKEGRAGWIIAGTWRQSEFQEALGEDLVFIDPWPAYEDGHLSGYVQTDNLYLSAMQVSANTLGALVDDDPQLAAWEFAQFMLSPQAQSLMAQAGLIPVVADASDLLPLTSQAVEALAGGTTYPILPAVEAYPAPLDFALQSVFENGVPPRQALAAAEAEIRTQLSNAAEPTPSP